jgi:hypothetical protein
LQRVPTSAAGQPPAVFLLCSLVLICGHKFPVIPRTAAARPQRAGHTQRFCGGQGPEFLVLTARMDHNLLWSFRLGFISKVFFWSDLVGPGRTHLDSSWLAAPKSDEGGKGGVAAPPTIHIKHARVDEIRAWSLVLGIFFTVTWRNSP